MKKIALLFLIGLIIAVFIAGIFASSSHVTFSYNGQLIAQPLTFIGGTFGIFVAAVAMFCISMLFIFLLTGIGLFILALLFSCMLIGLAFMLPILSPILLPLFLLSLFFICIRNKRKNAKYNL